MVNTDFISFEQYLMNKGIEIVNKKSINKKEFSSYSTKEIMEYIDILGEFHKKALGYDIYFINKLENNTGRLLESYKIDLRKLQKHLYRIAANEPNDIFEEYLMKVAQEFICRAEDSIKTIYESNYFELIKRSMKRVEVCIGGTGIYKLNKKETLQLTDIEVCNYDLVEIDCIKLIYRLKRSRAKVDYEAIINYFCEVEKLDNNSKKFIKAFINYPHEFMKCCCRYIENKREWNPVRYKARLVKAINQDKFLGN